ncbi:tape measure protein [Vibrio mediterranei]
MSYNNDLKLTLRFDVDNKRFVNEVKQNEQALKTLGTQTTSTSRRFTQAGAQSDVFSGQLSRVRSSVLALATGFSALQVAQQAAQRLAQYQDIRTRIEGLVGSNEAWLESEQYLMTLSGEHNKVLTDMADNYARLLTLQDAGLLTQAEARKMLEGMSNAQSQTGATSVSLSQSMYGLSQAIASPVVHAEELNQVVEPLPGLLNKLDAAAGLSSGGFRQMVLAGKVTSRFFKSTLIEALSDYDGAAARTGDNLSAQYAKVENAYTKAVVAFESPINDTLSPLLRTTSEGLSLLADNADTVSTVVGVTLAVAMGRATAAITAKSRAAARSAITSQIAAKEEYALMQAEVARLQVEKASYINTIRRIQSESMRDTVRKRLTVTTRALTIAETQLDAAAKRASLSQAALNVASRTGGVAMAALGGPAGLAMMAAGAIGYFALNTDKAERSGEDLQDRIDMLLGRFDKLNRKQLNKAIEDQTKKIIALEKEYQNVILAPAPAQTAWQKLTESNSEMRARQVKEAKETAQNISDAERKLSEAKENLATLKKKLSELGNKPASNSSGEGSAQTQSKAAEKLLENLKRQVALYGQVSNEAKIRYDIEKGDLKDVSAEMKQQLLLQAKLLDAKKPKNTKDIDKFYSASDAINTDFQKRLAIRAVYEESQTQLAQKGVERRLALLADSEAKQKIEEDYAFTERNDKLTEQFQAAYTQAKDNQNLQHDLEREYFNTREALRRDHEQRITDITDAAAQQRTDLEKQATIETLTNYQSFVSGLGTVFHQVGSLMAKSGKDSEAMFYANQTVAIANAIVNTELAATKALAYNENMSMAQALTSDLAIRALGYTSVGLIAGQTLAGQAHDGIDRVPRSNEGTWMLKANEMVLNPSQADNFRWMVSIMNQLKGAMAATSAANGNAAGSGSTVVNIHNNTGEPVSYEESVDRSGQHQMDVYIGKAVAASKAAIYEDADNGGPLSSRIRQVG